MEVGSDGDGFVDVGFGKYARGSFVGVGVCMGMGFGGSGFMDLNFGGDGFVAATFDEDGVVSEVFGGDENEIV